MLLETIGDLLPSAVGVALSPVPIIAVILVLGTPKARANGLAFAAGWLIGLIVVSSIVLIVADDAADTDGPVSTGVSWIQIIIGGLFLLLAAKQWQGRPREGEEVELPKWMAAVDTFSPRRSLLIGVALSGVNPKNLALTVAAAGSIAQAGLSGSDSAIAVAVFVIIGSLTVAGPVAFYLAAPRRAAASLATVQHFMSRHNAVIMMVVLLILGVKVLGQGLAGVAVP